MLELILITGEILAIILFMYLIYAVTRNPSFLPNYKGIKGVVCNLHPLTVYLQDVNICVQVKSSYNIPYELGAIVKIIKQEDGIYFIK